MITLLSVLTLYSYTYVVMLTGRDSVLNSDNTRTNFMYVATMMVDKPFPQGRYSDNQQYTAIVGGHEYKGVIVYDTHSLRHAKDILKDSGDLLADKFFLNDELKRIFFRQSKKLGYKPLEFNLMVDKE